jgi:hypothetical protein
MVRIALDSKILYEYDGSSWTAISSASAVTGPGSSTDNAIVRFDGTGGVAIQNSVVTIADSTGNIAGAGTISAAEVTSSSLTASRALVSGSLKEIQSATTTATEIGYVNGVTSAIQTQLGTKAAGAASSTDTAIARFSGTGGKTLQNSGVTIDGSNNVAGAASQAVGGALVASTVATFTSTTGALLLPRMTSTQRDNLTGTNGMLIYNSTLEIFQGYTNGAWTSLQGWGS